MIIRHKIVIENNEEILVVYLDNNLTEFADELGENATDREKNLKQQVDDYIKTKNVGFNGNVVKVLAGALLVATLALAPGVGTPKVSAQALNTSYVVQSGDSLYKIANNYGLTINQIKQLNNLTSNLIYPGQALTVQETTVAPSGNIYIVQSGDTLNKISGVVNISVNQLMVYNNLTSDNININQTLLLVPNATVGVYTVASGDTLWKIANQYGMTVSDLQAMNNTSENLFPGQKINVIEKQAANTYTVASGDTLWIIANNHQMTVSELQALNNLTTTSIVPGQVLNVTGDVTAQTPTTYTVKAGDSLWAIANSYQMTVSELQTLNNLTTTSIVPGQVLNVTGDVMAQAPTTYTVKAGDSLWAIANSYKMTVSELQTLNNLTTTSIVPGEVLNVTGDVMAQTPTTYTVKAGDSLWAIANNYQMTVSELQTLNNLTTTSITPGQVLNITNILGTVTPVATNIMVTVQRSSGEIQTIPLEQYVAGVVASELGAGYNDASYKAQALAARTYAVKRINEGLILTDTTSNQVYRDPAQLQQLWGSADYNTYYPEIVAAVNETSGQVIEYNGQLIDALFFSTSNGRTEDPVYVWGGDVPYLKSVSSSYDTQSPYYYHVNTYSYNEFATRLGISSANLYANVLTRTANGSVNAINISGRTFSGTYVESHLGLNSTDFDISFSNGQVTITQRGWGHGVGLSQYGAYMMGQEGYSYQQIIHHYYTGVDIVTL